MPAKTFLLSKKTNKEILKLPLQIQNKISKAFIRLKENPLSGAKLGGEMGGNYKLRVGDYRIVYKFNSKESQVDVVKVEHRQGIYK